MHLILTVSIPLHCGAVVASSYRTSRRRRRDEFQSPSLRGSGRFLGPKRGRGPRSRRSQSPSLRGSGRFSYLQKTNPTVFRWSQSPSLRGSGRFDPATSAQAPPAPASQSPSLRGSGRFAQVGQVDLLRMEAGLNPLHCGAVVASAW